MRPASCARHVLRRSALACSVLAVRRAACTLARRGRTGSLASCPRSKRQLSAAGRKQMQPPTCCRSLPLPPVASGCSFSGCRSYPVVRPAPYPPRLWRSSARAGAWPPALAAASARALLRLVTSGFHGWFVAWRRGAAGCGGVRLAPRGGAAAAAGAGSGVAAALHARVAFPAPVVGGAPVSAVCAAWAVWCAPRAHLVARGPPRAAALLRPWWLAAASVVFAAAGLLDVAALAAVKGARLPGARPYVSRARYFPARAGRATAVMPPRGGGMGYRNGKKPPENGPNRHQNVTKSPFTILQKWREQPPDQISCR